MSSFSNEDYGKKFQLTDSLLKRVLCPEDYEGIKIVEPVIFVSSDNLTCKQLKNPGYKHAVVSNRHLYIINTPAKHETDILLSLPLKNIGNVELKYDKADFLQGDLKENAQHIKLLCRHHSIIEHLLFKATSLTMFSPKTDIKRNCSISAATSKSTEDNKSLINKVNGTGNDILNMSSSINISSQRKTKVVKSHKKDASSRNGTNQRPLPKPVAGTELLNASYTQTMLKNKLLKDEKDTGSNSIQSCDLKISLSSRKNLYSSGYLSQKHLKESAHLSQSWNDLLKTVQSSKSISKKEPTTIQSSSISMSGSLSAKIFRRMKNNVPSSSTESKQDISNEEDNLKPKNEDSKYLSAETAVSTDGANAADSNYTMDIYTVSRGSIFFNIIEQAWVYSVIAGTLALEKSLDSTRRKCSSKLTEKKSENDAIVQKFTQLKEEILASTQYDEMFLLTKEMKHACDNYEIVKKSIWKSPLLLKFYMSKLLTLGQSDSTLATNRMDELDVMILIGELFVSSFQDSEMIGGRDLVLNDNNAFLVKTFLNVSLTNPRMKCLSKECSEEMKDELFDLIDTWQDTCVAILFEIINAAKQSLWCRTIEHGFFNTRNLVTMLSKEEKKLENLIDHIIQKLKAKFSLECESIPSPSSIVTLYKYMYVLHFICVHKAPMVEHVKEYYHEEVKYYISKEDNIKKIPKNYPVTCLITSLLSDLLAIIM